VVPAAVFIRKASDSLAKSRALQLLLIVVIIGLVAIIGNALIGSSHADSILPPNLDATQGTVGGGASVISDSTALNGKCTVYFGSVPSGTTSCNSTGIGTNTPPPPSSVQPVSGIAPPGGGTWNLAFDDEFNLDNDNLNSSDWSVGWPPTSNPVSPPDGGTSTPEDDCYLASNVTVTSTLNLSVTPNSANTACNNGASEPWYGSFVSSAEIDGGGIGPNLFSVSDTATSHGAYIEARITMPTDSSGTVADWPGFWADSYPSDGELDIAEGLNGQICYHFHNVNGAPGACPAGNYAGTHTFAAEWNPTVGANFYYDGQYVGNLPASETSNNAMRLLISNTVGSYGGPQEASTMNVSYVRVWD